MFEVKDNSTVTCPATNCWEKFPNVTDMIHHLGERCDLSKVQAGRDQFEHQYCLSNIARLFSCEFQTLIDFIFSSSKGYFYKCI